MTFPAPVRHTALAAIAFVALLLFAVVYSILIHWGVSSTKLPSGSRETFLPPLLQRWVGLLAVW